MKQVRRQSFTITNRRLAGNVPTWSPFAEEAYPQNYMVGQPKNHISALHLEKFPTPSTFPCGRTVFKTEVCSGSHYPPKAMRWTEEVEMATSVDDLKTSQSIFGYNSQTPRCLMQRLRPLSVMKIIQNSHFKKEDQSRRAEGSTR